jgi:hypothetical protein
VVIASSACVGPIVDGAPTEDDSVEGAVSVKVTRVFQYAADPAMCLSSQGATAGSKIDLEPCSSSNANQLWNLVLVNNQYGSGYMIQNQAGTLCIDLGNVAHPLDAQLTLSGCGTSQSAHQVWQTISSGPAFTVKDQQAGVCVDLYHSNPVSGGVIQAHTCNGGKGQDWLESPPSSTETLLFPSDSGMINVRSYGAKGDGATDDTAAIQRAISENIEATSLTSKRILYFPNGTYMISDTLFWKNTAGVWRSYMTFQGENQGLTKLKLTDHNPKYQNVAAPADVIDMGTQEPFNSNGGGYAGFNNFILNMTIDTGIGNPGAVAVDFLGNNYCGMRDVSIQSSDPAHIGHAGISMLRYASGPCLMKNISINGFQYGVTVQNGDYGITFENLSLSNQSVYGILNNGDILSIRNLFSTNPVPAISNNTTNGLVTLIGAQLNGGNAANAAIVDVGALYARSVSAQGYKGAIGNASGQMLTGASVTEYISGKSTSPFGGPPSALNLPVEETPAYHDPALAHWKSVVAYGADPLGKTDSTHAIQAAFDSGATTVYFPTGDYMVTGTIHVHGALAKVDGMGSRLLPSGANFQDATHPTQLMEIDAGTASSVTFYRLEVGASASTYPGLISFLQNSSRPMVLLDSAYSAKSQLATYQNTSTGTGTLYVENVCGKTWNILHPQKMFARQFDAEVAAVKLNNVVGTAWILGIKTEQSGSVLEAGAGSSTEVLGGNIYPLSNVPVADDGFVINDARVSLTYALSAYQTPSATTPDSDYKTQFKETYNGVTKSLASSLLAPRGYGVMVPLYRSGK